MVVFKEMVNSGLVWPVLTKVNGLTLVLLIRVEWGVGFGLVGDLGLGSVVDQGALGLDFGFGINKFGFVWFY